MKYTILICIALPAFLFSCSKDNDPSPKCDAPVIPEEPTINEDFSVPTAEGTYWVYEYHSIDSLGSRTPIFEPDTVTLLGDTVINGLSYQMYDRLNFLGSEGISFRRTTLGTVYNELGDQIYSTNQFNFFYNIETIEYPLDEYLNISHIMKDKRDQVVSVPFGVYNCIDREVWHSYDGFPEMNSCGNTELIFHCYLADGIGEVKYTAAFIGQFINSCTIIEKSLIEFYEP